MFKRANVVMLPTNKKASLCISQDKLTRFYGIEPDNEILVYRHLYIISDDKIEEGHYCMFYNQVSKVLEINGESAKIETCTTVSKEDAEFINSVKGKQITREGDNGKMIHSFNIKQLPKIIATTDTSIEIKSEQAGDNAWYNPYPRPSDSFISKFIEEYNKGNIITDVMVEYEQKRIYGDELDIHGHNKEVVKVNSKDNTITIKKIKDSWNRTEVIKICKDLIKGRECKATFMCYTPIITDVDKWLNDNL